MVGSGGRSYVRNLGYIATTTCIAYFAKVSLRPFLESIRLEHSLLAHILATAIYPVGSTGGPGMFSS